MEEKIFHKKEVITLKEYKCIPASVGLVIDSKGSYNNAVNSYANLINQETQGGWQLELIQSVPITKRAGCIAGLFGASDVTTYFNMLVFSKEK